MRTWLPLDGGLHSRLSGWETGMGKRAATLDEHDEPQSTKLKLSRAAVACT